MRTEVGPNKGSHPSDLREGQRANRAGCLSSFTLNPGQKTFPEKRTLSSPRSKGLTESDAPSPSPPSRRSGPRHAASLSGPPAAGGATDGEAYLPRPATDSSSHVSSTFVSDDHNKLGVAPRRAACRREGKE